MAANPLSDITTKTLSISNLILVSPQKTIGYQPQPSPILNSNTSTALPALVFNYEGEQTATLESDVTDHYIEDNTTIQDNIALKPEIITTHGFIGELNDVAPSFLAPVQQLAQKLTSVGAFVPGLSVTALNAYNEAFFLYQSAANVVNSVTSAWATINGGGESVINGAGITLQPAQTKQQQYFQQFYSYWRQRALFTIQTPWAVFQNMALMSVRAIQSEETNVITDFELKFKLLRFAKTVLNDNSSIFDNNNFDGRAADAGANPVSLGTESLTPSSTTFASQLA